MDSEGPRQNDQSCTKNNQIKDEQHVVLRDLDRIIGRWKGCIDKLLNEENHSSVFEDRVPHLTQGISRNEVKVTLSGMKKGKTTGTADTIFAVRQRMEKHTGKRDCTCIMVFIIDLEKAYDRVPRQEVWMLKREKEDPDKYVMMVQGVYEGARTRGKKLMIGSSD